MIINLSLIELLFLFNFVNMSIIKVSNEQEVITKLSNLIESISNDSIEKRGKFFIGLSGGSLVKYLCSSLPTVKTSWDKWVVAFCDERVVPEDSEDSTFGVYKRNLIPKTQLSENQFVTIKQGVKAKVAAEDYAEKLKNTFEGDIVFDLLLLGMGPDGHTCSLFPGHPLLNETSLLIAPIDDSPKPPPSRVTLTYPVINSSRNAIFAVSGAGKADMIKRIFKDKEPLPAALVKPAELYWIIDNDAAQFL